MKHSINPKSYFITPLHHWWKYLHTDVYYKMSTVHQLSIYCTYLKVKCLSKSAPNSLLSKDPNLSKALKEVLSSLNETVNRLFSICIPLHTIVTHNSIESQKYDLISSQNLPDIYELMIALSSMTYNLLTDLHELTQNNPTALPTNLWTNSYATCTATFLPHYPTT